ncbi:hypothetical protein AVEN_162365-1 [Araneus ventricosus]|uniref:Uncharacterized protein n=1 Tax=Araneus ventricosus TaxID=182803 RepID=A0A4Y2U0Y5_ARAVE|nr:hypothetical protein AVEN_162365-1 [Araneus ventricosus]
MAQIELRIVVVGFRLHSTRSVICLASRVLNSIISDSRSALMSLALVYERRLIINEIKNNIMEYLGDIQLIWTRAHRGFEGNERADLFAKMASTKDHVDFSFSPSRIQIKNAAAREILEAWQQSLSGSSNARWTYSLLSKVDYKRMYGDFFLILSSRGYFFLLTPLKPGLIGRNDKN